MPLPGPSQPLLYNEKFPQYAGRLFGQQALDWQDRVDMNRMRRERADRLRSCMKEAGVGVMLLMMGSNIRYATSWYPVMYHGGGSHYVLFPVKGEPILFGHGSPTLHHRRELSWIKPENIRYGIPSALGMMSSGLWTHRAAWDYQMKKLTDQLKSALLELGLSKEVLVLDGGDGGLQSALDRVGVKTSARVDIVAKAMEIKTKDEVECLRQSAAICDAVQYEFGKYLEPGKTEHEMTGYLNWVARKLGAESSNAQCWGGQYTWPRTPGITDRRARPGDIFFLDAFEVRYQGYATCYYRTFSVLTQPSQAAKDAYKRIREWVYAALSECKPGKTTADMLKHWPDEKQYYGLDPDYMAFDNVMHGIGLYLYGAPQATKAWAAEHPYEIKEGHCFSIETIDGIGDGQGVRLEEMVTVTKDGYEVLSRYPIDEITVCPLR